MWSEVVGGGVFGTKFEITYQTLKLVNLNTMPHLLLLHQNFVKSRKNRKCEYNIGWIYIINESINECIKEWINEWKCDYINEWMNK